MSGLLVVKNAFPVVSAVVRKLDYKHYKPKLPASGSRGGSQSRHETYKSDRVATSEVFGRSSREISLIFGLRYVLVITGKFPHFSPIVSLVGKVQYLNTSDFIQLYFTVKNT